MIDISILRETPKIVKDNLKRRGMDEKQVDNFLELDENWRKSKKELDDLRAKRNKISLEINEAKKQGKDIQDLIKEVKSLPEQLSKKEEEIKHLEEKREKLWRNLPNILDKSVPLGDETKNKVLKSYRKGKKGKEGHTEILEKLDLVDVKKASEVSGTRFYYLKNELVKLNYAIINFALDFLAKKKFILVQPPYMLRKAVLEGAITMDTFEDAIYKIENDDLYLIGTAEHALNALYFNNNINHKELPIRMAGISPCFRKEAGAHGKDTKGIFRVHQFEKVEQFVICNPKDSWKEFDLILKNTIEMLKLLGIPFRTIILASQDTGRVPAKTIDIEGWFPSQNTYRELGSCSNCTDYQARRSNIRFQDKDELKFVNTLNNTAIATERMMTCIVENNLQKNGSIKIPKVLQKYTGFKEIKAKK